MRISSKTLIAIALVAGVFIPQHFALGSVSSWSKAISIYPKSPSDFESDKFDQVLQQIVDDHANTIILIIPFYTKNQRATTMTPGYDTPSDESIVTAIQKAHKKNLKVMLKLHLDTTNGVWRADINPTNRDEWYRNYENLILHYAVIGQIYGAEQICLGTELISMAAANVHADNTARWRSLIADVRKIYDGQLTYSANWGPSTSSYANEKDHIEFWSDLDFIGMSAYFRLETSDNSVDALVGAWDTWYESDIKPLSDKFGKPIQFTEIGYRSVSQAHIKPYDFQGRGSYDSQEQVNSYVALFKFWDDKPEVTGVGVWDYYVDPTAGGEGNTDYTPQNKPAEDVLRVWFTPPPSPVVELPVPRKRSIIDTFKNWGDTIQSFLQLSATILAYLA